MDVHDQLARITATVRDAKAMPMSASCLVNRAELLEDLESLRACLPADLEHADALLSDRDAIVASGQAEADRLLEAARAEREQLLEQTDVLVSARERAAEVIAQARAEATRLLSDADDYVDRKLGEFEVVLGQLAAQVGNGRERLAARREADLARIASEGEDADRAVLSGRPSHPDEAAGRPEDSLQALGERA
jgi:cell division septum initiation protein DivIVA